MHAINRILITLGYMVVVIILLMYTPNFVNRTIAGTNLGVNNNNITADLKSPIISKNDNFYMELKDIKNFLDEYIVEEFTKKVEKDDLVPEGKKDIQRRLSNEGKNLGEDEEDKEEGLTISSSIIYTKL